MKSLILSTLGGLALLALAPAALAGADVHVNLGFGLPYYVEPPPVYYEPRREYYVEPPPVYYGPRVVYRDRDRDWDDYRGHGRGHYRGDGYHGHHGHHRRD